MKEEEDAPKRIAREPFSRFGSCVAAVGDLDGDGYEGSLYTLHFNLSFKIVVTYITSLKFQMILSLIFF